MKLYYIMEETAIPDPFFKLPKVLFYEESFRGISLEAKLLYCFLLDRVSLSKQNHWVDDLGRIYICYTLEEASKMLQKSRTTVTKLYQELDDKSGCGLIYRKKRGQGKADLIYVKIWEKHKEKEDDLEEEIREITPETAVENKGETDIVH